MVLSIQQLQISYFHFFIVSTLILFYMHFNLVINGHISNKHCILRFTA